METQSNSQNILLITCCICTYLYNICMCTHPLIVQLFFLNIPGGIWLISFQSPSSDNDVSHLQHIHGILQDRSKVGVGRHDHVSNVTLQLVGVKNLTQLINKHRDHRPCKKTWQSQKQTLGYKRNLFQKNTSTQKDMRCAATCLPLEIRSEQLSSANKRFTAGILWASNQRIYSMWFTETKQYIYIIT